MEGVAHIIMAEIFLLGGQWGPNRPVNTFFALASVLGLVLIYYGSFEVARAVASRAINPYWWTGLITGSLLILLAFWVSGSDRVYALRQRAYLILFWIGFMALLKGITQIMLPLGFAASAKKQTTTLRGANSYLDLRPLSSRPGSADERHALDSEGSRSAV